MGQIHMFVFHFSLASVTESESWSSSLGLKDFFPPAPVRCPNFHHKCRGDVVMGGYVFVIWW